MARPAGTGANSGPRPGWSRAKMRERPRFMALAATDQTTITAAFGPAVALSCRECGTRYDLGPSFACIECFGPLEVAYRWNAQSAGDADAAADAEPVTRERIAAGPPSIWRYRALLPVPSDVADKPN